MKFNNFFCRQQFKSLAVYGISRPTSDLFLWPKDSSYNVSICLKHLNLLSTCFEDCLNHYFEIYDEVGNCLYCSYLATNELSQISELISLHQHSREVGSLLLFGSFSLFSYHYLSGGPQFSERALLSFSSKNSISYIHGNLNERALVLSTVNRSTRTVSGFKQLWFNTTYYIPIHYYHTICPSSYLTYNFLVLKNCLDKELGFTILVDSLYTKKSSFYCKNYTLRSKQIVSIDLRELKMLEFESYYTISIKSRLFMLRPILLTIIDGCIARASHS